MTHEFTFLLVVLLASRLVYTFNDAPLPTRRVIVMIVVQLLGLAPFEITLPLLLLGLVMVVQAIVFRRFETRAGSLEGMRILSFVISLVLISVFCSPSIGMGFNAAVLNALSRLPDYSVLLAPVTGVSWGHAGVIVLGFFIVLNEANLVLRLLLRRLNLAPHRNDEAGPSDDLLNEGEYNTGRVIGILERTLIYVAVLNNDVAAIGLVLAAKAFTRFKEFDNRRFAEYVLIGTLASAFLAVAVAMIMKAIS